MNKADLTRTIDDAHPELPTGLHLPRLAVVTAIPDPPKNGETSHHPAPKYAVSVQLLTPQLDVDPDLPELRDVPVCLPAAGAARGIAALPQPGTVVEVAFAYGQLHLPFIRSALPYELELPQIDADHMRWQHTAETWQQADATGWQRITTGTITDHADGDITTDSGGSIADTAGADISHTAAADIIHTAGAQLRQLATDSLSQTAPEVWLGSDATNFLELMVDYMAHVHNALISLSNHTHPGTSASSSGPGIAALAGNIEALRNLLLAITKSAP